MTLCSVTAIKKQIDILMVQMQLCGHKENFREVVARRIVARYNQSLYNTGTESR